MRPAFDVGRRRKKQILIPWKNLDTSYYGKYTDRWTQNGTDLTAGPLRRLVGWPVWKASMANLAWKKGKYYGTQ